MLDVCVIFPDPDCEKLLFRLNVIELKVFVAPVKVLLIFNKGTFELKYESRIAKLYNVNPLLTVKPPLKVFVFVKVFALSCKGTLLVKYTSKIEPFGNVIVPVIVKSVALKLVAVKLLTVIELLVTEPSVIVVPFPSVIVTIPFKL